MSLAAVVSPYQPINGLTGLGLNNGFLYIGIDGQDPETNPQACFWDAAGTIPATQPVSILGGYPMRLGTPTRLYTGSTYSIRVRDASLAQVFYEAHAVPNPIPTLGVFGTLAAAAAEIIPVTLQATGLVLSGYAVEGDAGAGAQYRYATVQAAGAGKFQSADGAWWELISNPLKIGYFGTGLTAWQTAAAVMNAGVSDTLIVPAGVYTINRAGLADPLHQGLITFTNNAGIRFEPGSEVQFDYIVLPLFCFGSCTRGGITGQPRFVFTGATPLATVCTRAQYSAAVPAFPFASWVGGGDYELFSLILSNSSNVTFENLTVEASTPNDEGHIVPFVFNIKPTSSTVRTTGVRIRNVQFRDFMFGILYAQQDDFSARGIDADRRAGLTTSGIGPGHVVYQSGLFAGTPNTNCAVKDLREGPNPINWPASIAQNLATFAIKDGQYCQFCDIQSMHPGGLVQSLQGVSDSDFRSWAWRTTDVTPLTTAPFNIVGDNRRNRFDRFEVYAPSKIFTFGADNSGVFSDNTFIGVFVDASFDLGGSPVTGVFDFYGSNNDIRDVFLKPHAAVVGVSFQSACVQRSNVGTGNTIEAQFIGQYVDPKMRRFTDSGTGSSALLGYRGPSTDTNYLANDQLPEAITKSTFVEAAVHHTRGWIADAGGTGAATVTFQLPGRGSFLVDVDVEDNARTGGQGGLYIVTFSNQAATIADVQLLGAVYTRGASVSALALSVSATGLLTVGYTKGSSFFATISLGWTRVGAIAT